MEKALNPVTPTSFHYRSLNPGTLAIPHKYEVLISIDVAVPLKTLNPTHESQSPNTLSSKPQILPKKRPKS